METSPGVSNALVGILYSKLNAVNIGIFIYLKGNNQSNKMVFLTEAKPKNQNAMRVTPLVFTNSNSIISYKTKCVRVVVDYADSRFSNFSKMKKFIQGLERIFLQNKLTHQSLKLFLLLILMIFVNVAPM